MLRKSAWFFFVYVPGFRARKRSVHTLLSLPGAVGIPDGAVVVAVLD